MRLSQLAPSAASLLIVLPHLASALTLDCGNVVVNGETYDFSALKGDRAVSWINQEADVTNNFTSYINICETLNMKYIKEKKNRCRMGTHVCGINEVTTDADADPAINKVINIAGNYLQNAGRPLDPKWTWIPDSGSHADVNRRGLRLELNGGREDFDNKRSEKQQAIIELLCDKDRDGLEDFDSMGMLREPIRLRYRDDDGDGDDGGDDSDDDNQQGCVDDDSGADRSLSFCSYRPERGNTKVLRLIWKTKHACPNTEGGGGSDDADGSSHWGFFTWLIVIIFLGVAGYLIFGSWLNYSRYGARGWDLVPHGETIRDIPYILKDFGRGITNSFGSGGSRGGYSAV